LVELDGDLVVAALGHVEVAIRLIVERHASEPDAAHTPSTGEHCERPDGGLLPPPRRRHPGSRSFTSSRSDSSSSVVILIFSCAHSSWSIPSTTDHVEPSLRTGYPNWSPSGMPYSPRLATATECQSSAGVGVTMLRTVSRAAWAADAADDAPRFWITSAP